MVKMQRWRHKKSPIRIFALLFSAFVVASILYNESNRQIQIQAVTHESAAAAAHSLHFASLPRNASNHYPKGLESGELDWSKVCSSSRNYSTHKGWISSKGKSAQGSRSRMTCNVFSGRWVFENESYPLYNEADCPYMSDQLACRKHGRPDSIYQNWKWQPHDCDLKRWNGTEMLEKLKDKRLMFVGDSLNRGQWISLVCLLQSAIGNGKKSMSPNSHLTIFRAEDYNASIEFHWSPLLVESNSDDPVNHRLADRIIQPETIFKHASRWEKADILIFNTYLWWRQGNVKLLWSGEKGRICEELDGLGAMKFAMEAWARWVDSNVNPLQKKVFFVTMSPTHLWSWEWEPGSEGNCFGEKTPINTGSYWGSGSDVPTMNMVESVLRQLGSKVSVLNVTQLSEYRKDGHPSIYRKFWETFSPQQLSNPVSYSDCLHWCLPGVPDVWNQLLFHHL